MADRPGEERADHGPMSRALAAAVRGNSTAFGFSITITVSFGVMQRLEGTGSILDLLLFGVAAALSISLIAGLVTRGFRERVKPVVPEVSMLGTAQDFLSIAAGVGAVTGAGELLGGLAAWVAAGFVAATVFVLVESVELVVAERVQRMRGDPEAGEHEDEAGEPTSA